MSEQRPTLTPSTPGAPGARPTPPAGPRLNPGTPPPQADSPIGLAEDDSPGSAASSKIRHSSDSTRRSAQYKRQPCTDGHGACRVRTFHGRLSDEGMGYMDRQINEWLDQHPEIEVKFVNTTVGLYDGKETALVMNVWY